MSLCYVVKSQILGPKGAIQPGVVLRNTNEFTRIGVETSEMNESIALWDKCGHIIMCDDTQVIDVIQGKRIRPSMGFGNTDGLDEKSSAPFRSEKDNELHTNDPNQKFGWDPKFLDQKDLNELRSMIKQIIPELPEVEVQKFERNKVIDILSAQHPSRLSQNG